MLSQQQKNPYFSRMAHLQELIPLHAGLHLGPGEEPGAGAVSLVLGRRPGRHWGAGWIRQVLQCSVVQCSAVQCSALQCSVCSVQSALGSVQ